MSENVRFILQVTANILATGFFIVLCFSQIADYYISRCPRHLAAALAWFALVPVTILRIAVLSKPPLLAPDFVMDWSTIFWTISIFFALIWGILKIWQRRKQEQAAKRLGIGHERDTDE